MRLPADDRFLVRLFSGMTAEKAFLLLWVAVAIGFLIGVFQYMKSSQKRNFRDSKIPNAGRKPVPPAPQKAEFKTPRQLPPGK